MSCNCKKNTSEVIDNGSSGTENLGKKITTYVLKFMGFLVVLLALPFINLGIIWFSFKTLVLNRNIDLKPLMALIGKKVKEKKNSVVNKIESN